MGFSVTDGASMLKLKQWAETQSVDLKRLNASGIERATRETGVSPVDVVRLAYTASTFTQTDYDALVKANRLSGELKHNAPTPQADLYGTEKPDLAWFDTRLDAAAQQGWRFEVQIPLWPDKRVEGKAVVDAIEQGKTIKARRTDERSTVASSDGPGIDYKVKQEHTFTTVGSLRAWLSGPMDR